MQSTNKPNYTMTQYNFNEPNGYTREIDSNTKMHIKPINNSISMLYFTNELNQSINIPDGISVVYNNNSHLLPVKNSYFLNWTDKYDVYLNFRIILSLKPERIWAIE